MLTRKQRLIIWGAVFSLLVVALILLHATKYLWIAVAGVGLGYFLVAEADWFRPAEPWLPARDIGIAFVISGLFALTYEGYIRTHAVEEAVNTVVTEVAPRYMTWPLPNQVADEVKYLGKLQMLRKDVDITITLTQSSGNPDSFTEQVDIVYTMVNYSIDSVAFTHVAGVTGGPRRAGVLLEAAASGRDLVGSEYDEVLGQPGDTLFARQVRIPPNSSEPNNKFKLRAKYPRHADDGDIIFSRDPVMNVTVTVEAPADLQVDVVFGHRNFRGTRVKSKIWELHGVLLPWSVVYIEWFRVAGKGANSSATTPRTAPTRSKSCGGLACLEEVVRPQLLGRIAHDFRRTAARNLRRAGVDEGTIMKLCGWKTRTMFDRYNIIDSRDLNAAVAKLAAAGKGS